jgi:hypothetical protein
VTVINLRGRLSSFNILDAEVREEWARLIGPADVLVFDCLRPALDALGLSEQNEAGRFLEALDEFCAACGIPETLLVHHMGHQNERSRGDSRLEDWPDAKWKLVKQADKDELDPDDQRGPRYFSAYGRDVDQAEVRLHFDPDTHGLSVNGGSRVASTRSRVEADVLAFITEKPGCSAGAIEKQVLGDTNDKRRAVRELEHSGHVRLIRQGVGKATLHYPVTPAERAASDFSPEQGENVENSDPENVENS